MFLWGVAVLELNSYPDHNKGPDHAPCTCPAKKYVVNKLFSAYFYTCSSECTVLFY